MAVDMFIKLEGTEGEAQDDSHGNEIDVLAWSWGMSQSGSFHVGGGGGAGKANFQDISVTKYIDKSTPDIMRKCAKGQHFPEAWLTVRKAGTDPLEYVKLHMEKVMVTSVSTGGSGGEDRLTENVTLNFSKFNYEYTPQKEDGSGDSVINFAYDITKNVEA